MRKVTAIRLLKRHLQGRPWAVMAIMLVMTLCVSLFAASLGLAATEGVREETIKSVGVDETYGKLPLYFIRNDGQMDEKVVYYEKASSHATYFTEDGVYLSLVRSEESENGAPAAPEGAKEKTYKTELVRLSFLDADMTAISAEGVKEAKINYLMGNDPAKWKSDVPTYGAVVYEGVYDGVDVKFYGNNRLLEYDIIVKPGADPSMVRLSHEGIEGLAITEAGDLDITLKEGNVIQKKPYVYQEIDGRRVEVDGRFRVMEDNGAFAYGFEVASYAKDRPLVIDPVLVYSTYLGGSDVDIVNGIAVDGAGRAYITGATSSTDFPTASALQGSFAGGYTAAFVTVIDPTGQGLVYSTYLGGSGTGYDYGRGIAVDSAGNTYVSGVTHSTDFPLASPFQGTIGGGNLYYYYGDAFVAKLDPSGAALYSTYLGGSSFDVAHGIAADNSGNAYVTGYTWSTDFPTASPFQNTNRGAGGSYDAFLTKINPSGTALVYSTYLGGFRGDIARAISVDSEGNAYLTGYTSSSDFPTASPVQGTIGGGERGDFGTYSDAFVTKMNPSGTALVYSTYLGGTYNDVAYDIAVDDLENVYVTGMTQTADFPTASPIQDIKKGSEDAFVTKINSSGTALDYSTYLGGSAGEQGLGITVDSTGNAYVSGFTSSYDFPTTAPVQGANGGGMADAFVTVLDPTGQSLVYSTYLGGKWC